MKSSRWPNRCSFNSLASRYVTTTLCLRPSISDASNQTQRALPNPQESDYLFAFVGVYFGGHLLAGEFSELFKASSSSWNYTVQFKRLLVCNVPRVRTLDFHLLLLA